MRRFWSPLTIGTVLVSLIVGFCIAVAAQHFDALTVNTTVALIDILQLAATLFLAFYIPLAIESRRDRERWTRDLLSNQIQLFLNSVSEANMLLRRCGCSGQTSPTDKIQIRSYLHTATLRLSELRNSARSVDEEALNKAIDQLSDCYDRYFTAVTGGTLYGDGVVDMALFRRQEPPFIKLDAAARDAIKAAAGE